MEKHSLRFEIDASSADKGVKVFDAAVDKAISSAGRLDSSLKSLFKKIESVSTQGFSALAKDVAKLGGVSLSSSLAKNLTALGDATKSFKGPSSSAIENTIKLSKALNGMTVSSSLARNMGVTSAALNSLKISPAAAKNIEALKTALTGLKPPAGIQNIVSLLNAMSNAALAAGSSMRSLNASVRPLTSTANSASSAFRKLNNDASLASAAIAGFSVAQIAQGIRGVAESVFDASASIVKFNSIMTAATGTSKGVADGMAFVKQLAAEMGVPILDTAERFAKFSIASDAAGVSMRDNEKIFKAMSVALTATGASANDSGLAFLAIEQMMSKGKVSAEELRRQLAERIPGAFGMMAEAIGVTTSKLDEMLRAGEVLSGDALPKFADVLTKRFGPGLATALNGPAVAFGRLKNAITEVYLVIGQSGFISALTTQMNNLTVAMSSPAFMNFARQVGDIAGQLTTVLGTALTLVANNSWILIPALSLVGAAFIRMGLSLTATAAGWLRLNLAMTSSVAASASAVTAINTTNAALLRQQVSLTNMPSKFFTIGNAMTQMSNIVTTVVARFNMLALVFAGTRLAIDLLLNAADRFGLLPAKIITSTQAFTLLDNAIKNGGVSAAGATNMIGWLNTAIQANKVAALEAANAAAVMDQSWTQWLMGKAGQTDEIVKKMQELATQFNNSSISAAEFAQKLALVNMSGASQEAIDLKDKLAAIAAEGTRLNGVFPELTKAIQAARAAAAAAGRDTAVYDAALKSLGNTARGTAGALQQVAARTDQVAQTTARAGATARVSSSQFAGLGSTLRSSASSFDSLASSASRAAEAVSSAANAASSVGSIRGFGGGGGGGGSDLSPFSSSTSIQQRVSDEFTREKNFSSAIDDRNTAQYGEFQNIFKELGLNLVNATAQEMSRWNIAANGMDLTASQQQDAFFKAEIVGKLPDKYKSIFDQYYRQGGMNADSLNLLAQKLKDANNVIETIKISKDPRDIQRGAGSAGGSSVLRDALEANTAAIRENTGSNSEVMDKLYNKLDLARRNISTYSTSDVGASFNSSSPSFRSIPGYANGVSGIVKGRGGRDKNLAMMRLSRGEGIDITPRNSVNNEASQVSVQLNLNGVVDAQSFIANRAAVDRAIKDAVKRAQNAG